MTKGLAPASMTSGCATGSSAAVTSAADSANFVVADVLVETVAAQHVGDVGGHVDAEIGLDQDVLELVEHRRVELALGEDGGNRTGQLVR